MARNTSNGQQDFKVVIPARYASTRLPGKPLLSIAGKPMLQHTYERALASSANEVVIATDDERIIETAKGFGADVMLTGSYHQSGTERLAEVVGLKFWNDDTIIVNVQGDEPLVKPSHIDLLAVSLQQHRQAGLATLASKITSASNLWETHVVKVVLDSQGYALYFSRSVIPWDREHFSPDYAATRQSLPDTGAWYRHIGMYAYRARTLEHYCKLPPCMPETTESLEQLRMLYHGIPVHVSVVDDHEGQGVDVEADIAVVEVLLRQQQ